MTNEEGFSLSKISNESEAIKTFYDFIDSYTGVPGTKSTLSKDIEVVDIRKVPVSNYSGAVLTKSTGLDLAVYELKLKTQNAQEGFAVVTDDFNTNQVLAYAPVGSISDTIYNKGLALFFRNVALLSESKMNQTQTKSIDPDQGKGNGDGSTNSEEERLFYTVGPEIYHRDLTKEEIEKYGSSWVYYGPFYHTRYTSGSVHTEWSQYSDS